MFTAVMSRITISWAMSSTPSKARPPLEAEAGSGGARGGGRRALGGILVFVGHLVVPSKSDIAVWINKPDNSV